VTADPGVDQLPIETIRASTLELGQIQRAGPDRAPGAEKRRQQRHFPPASGDQLRIPGKTIRNPAGWLAVLSKRVAQGAALPLAESEADLRRQQEKVKLTIERSMAGIGSKPALSKPETEADPEQGKKAFQTWYQRKRRGL
jgi:hypothetical protein